MHGCQAGNLYLHLCICVFVYLYCLYCGRLVKMHGCQAGNMYLYLYLCICILYLCICFYCGRWVKMHGCQPGNLSLSSPRLSPLSMPHLSHLNPSSESPATSFQISPYFGISICKKNSLHLFPKCSCCWIGTADSLNCLLVAASTVQATNY